MLIPLMLFGPAASASAQTYGIVRICEAKFEGQFYKATAYPIYNDQNNRIGRLATALQWEPRMRICAATIRKYHAKPRFTGVAIKYVGDSKWRRKDHGYYYQYAGPVVLRLHKGDCVYLKGHIRSHRETPRKPWHCRPY